MKITRLKLEGYKRLLLNNIQSFEFKPESIFQIIIGTNGSGKSSVLYELTPLPALPGNYTKDGSKTIELEHRGSNYILTSTFKPNHHSFLKDDVELNDGGTAAVQKTLCEKHFGLDQQLKEVLIDEVVFTQMSPQQRREWITRLSGGDLNYAITIYNQLKTKLRDQQGAVKHLKDRLVKETDKLSTPEAELNDMRQRAEVLAGELSILMEGKTPGIQKRDVLEKRLDDLLKEIDNVSTYAIKLNVEKNAHICNYTDWETISGPLQNDIKFNDKMLEHYQKEYSELSDVIEAVDKTGAQDSGSLKLMVSELEDESVRLKESVNKFFILDEPRLAQEASLTALEIVSELFSELPDNTDRKYSREAIDKCKSEIEDIQDKLDKMKAYRNRALERIEHIKSAKDTECPKCKYVWIPGVSDNELIKLQENLEKAGKSIEELNDKYKTVKFFYDACSEYGQQFSRFKKIVADYPRLKPLWDEILEKNYLYENPNSKHFILDYWKKDVDISVNYLEIKEKIKEYESAITQLENMDKGGTHFSDRVKQLEDSIEECTSLKVRLQKEYSDLQAHYKRLKNLYDKNYLLVDLNKQLEDVVKELVIATKNFYLDKCIQEHQVSLGMIQNDIIRINSAEDIIKDIQTHHDVLEQDVIDYKILQDELSPTDGFIADQLLGFIQHLVDEMNGIISNIWTYDMEILSCGLESGELDYRFPLRVKGNDLTSPDVAKSSSSQVDIVNFAFKLIVMLYLDIQDYPIYLDELAPSLDEQHRINIMNFVKQLVEGNRCSQMFMISHYRAGHGVFTAADYCVMDSQNITIPDQFNKHVIIK